MTKEQWHRLLMHLPWGAMGGWITFACPIPFIWQPVIALPMVLIGIFATLLMCIYEAFNDWRKKDKSYMDVVGIVWGFQIMVILILAWLRW